MHAVRSAIISWSSNRQIGRGGACLYIRGRVQVFHASSVRRPTPRPYQTLSRAQFYTVGLRRVRGARMTQRPRAYKDRPT